LNFNDFVNLYRIKALMQKLEEREHDIQTLLSLAFECGFNSKSTFNRAFKRYTTLSPKEYIQKHYPK
jgi:AraC-like DNA-binding protein